MALLKNIFNEITISNQSGADYASLNDAITDIGSIKTFRIESAIVLTASIIMPAGCTLVMGTAGSISGAYTITGNDTILVFEGLNSSISSTVSFAGTWQCAEVTPEQFGAVGNAVLNGDNTVTGTDDQNALTKMFAFAALTVQKKIKFGCKKTYYSTGGAFGVGNMVIDGNHATLLKDDSHCISGSGTCATFANITKSAYKNDSWVHCTDAALLATLAAGDCIKIKSTEVCQPTSGEASYMGEIHLVRSVDTVNGIIYLNENLHWYYLLSDAAQVAKVTLINVSISNLKLWSISEVASAVALSFSFANIDFNNIFTKAFYYGVLLIDCWKPKVSMTSFQQDKDGVGYGITVGGATMYADITFLNIGCRHSFTTSGNYSSAGIVWGARIHDSIAIPSVAVAAGPFDTHASSGSVYFDNCIVFGGIWIAYASAIEDWDADTTFAAGARVRSLIEHDLYYAQAETTGDDPEDASHASIWNGTNANNCTAFKSEGLYCYYTNCKAYNVAQGFYVYGPAMKETNIKDCEVFNCINGLYSKNDAVVENLIIDGLRVHNDHYMSQGYGILLCCIYTYGLFRNIDVKNLPLISIIAPCNPVKFELTNFTHETENALQTVIFNHKEITQIILTNGRTKGAGALLVDWNDNGHVPTVLAMLNNITCENSTGVLINFGHAVENVILNGVVCTNPAGEYYFISFGRACTSLSMSNCAYIGTNAKNIIYTDAAYALTNLLHNNNIFPACTAFRTGTGALAALELLGGSVGAKGVIRGVGTPEGAVVAEVGTMYLRNNGGANTTLYIKESGTGNTGWVAK